MDFRLTDTQEMLRDDAWNFAQKEILGDDGRKWLEFRKKGFPHEFYKKLVSKYGGATIDIAYGGAGIGTLDFCLITEQLSQADAGAGLSLGTSLVLVADPIQLFGNEEQKRLFLPRIARGEIGAYAQTEAGAGSDVNGIKTKGVISGNEIIINGSKIFITNGSVADIIIVIVRTGPEKYRGLSMVIVDAKKAKTEGSLIIERDEDKLGLHCSPTTALTFTDCRVPVFNVVGQPGMGFFYAMATLIGSRPMIAWQGVGMAQAAFDLALKHVLEREQFSKKLYENQSVQHELADMKEMIEGARLLAYQAAWEVEKTLEFKADPLRLLMARVEIMDKASMAKLRAADEATPVILESLKLHGGMGFMKESRIAGLWEDLPILHIYEGASKIQKYIIAKQIFKKHGIDIKP